MSECEYVIGLGGALYVRMVRNKKYRERTRAPLFHVFFFSDCSLLLVSGGNVVEFLYLHSAMLLLLHQQHALSKQEEECTHVQNECNGGQFAIGSFRFMKHDEKESY